MAKISSIAPEQIYPDRRVYLDYLAGRKELAPFYKHYPTNEKSLQARVQQLAKNPQPRQNLSELLIEYNTSLAAGEKTIHNARLLAQPRTLAVITGQQPGFAGGPLYNIYKAVTAIKLARHLAQTTRQDVVPIFWIASEDANKQEIDHTAWLDRQGQLKQIRVQLPDAHRQISCLQIGPAVRQAFGELTDLLPDSEFRPYIQQLYQPCPDEPWPRWFGRIYAQLFADQGLVLIEPQIIYAQAADIFGRIVSRLPELSEPFDRCTSRLIDLGYDPQIQPQTRKMLYTVSQGLRQAVIPPDDNYDLAGLSELSLQSPQDLSCSVMLRPIVQDFLLPTVAYVAGPGEIAYYAQLCGLYEQLEVSMPVIWPRASATLVEPNIARLIEKSGLTEQQLLNPSGSFQAGNQIDSNSPAAQHLQQLAEQAKNSLAELADTLKTHEPSLKRFADKTSSRLARDLGRLLQRGLQALDQRNQITNRQRHHVGQSLRPHGQPQERVFGLFPFLAYYGQDVLQEIVSQLDIFDFHHWLLYLDFSSPPKLS